LAFFNHHFFTIFFVKHVLLASVEGNPSSKPFSGNFPSLSLCVSGQLSEHFFSFQLSEQDFPQGFTGGIVLHRSEQKRLTLQCKFQGDLTKIFIL
jgi:hypothetical protein